MLMLAKTSGWNCTFCAHTDNRGDTCQNCGAPRPVIAPLSTLDFVRSEKSAAAIFLANPANKKFASGRSQHLGVKPGQMSVGCFTVFMLPFMIAGIFLLGAMATEIRNFIQLSRDGVVTQGTVTNREIDDDTDGATYYVSYRYNVSDHVYSNRLSVEREVYNSADQDQKVSIIYSRSMPTISYIGTTPAHRNMLLTVGFGFCWNAFLSVFILMWLKTLQEAGKYRQLAREGRLLPGQTVRCKGYEAKDSDGDPIYMIQLGYKFRTPTGEELYGEKEFSRADLRKKALPAEGTPVAVLYASPSFHEVL